MAEPCRHDVVGRRNGAWVCTACPTTFVTTDSAKGVGQEYTDQVLTGVAEVFAQVLYNLNRKTLETWNVAAQVPEDDSHVEHDYSDGYCLECGEIEYAREVPVTTQDTCKHAWSQGHCIHCGLSMYLGGH